MCGFFYSMQLIFTGTFAEVQGFVDIVVDLKSQGFDVFDFELFLCYGEKQKIRLPESDLHNNYKGAVRSSCCRTGRWSGRHRVTHET